MQIASSLKFKVALILLFYNIHFIYSNQLKEKDPSLIVFIIEIPISKLI